MKDLVTSMLLFAAAIAYFVATRQINQSALADEFGAAGLPQIYAYLLAAIALSLAAKALLSARFAPGSGASREHGAERRAGRNLARAGGMLGIGVAYLLAVPYLGYLLTLICVIALVAWYQHERAGPKLLLVSVGGGIIFYAFFVLLLGIDMPAGAWSALAGS